MDPLSITASVVALFTITAQLISAVGTITESVKTQPAVLRSVIQELTALHMILDKLKSLSASNPSTPQEDKALLLVLDGCMEIYESIGEEMKGIQSSLGKSSIRKLYIQMSFSSKLKKLDPLRDQLEKFKATLSLALHVRNMNVSPQDLREEISDLRSDLSAYRSGQTSHSDRLGSIQQYLMTTSAILERQKIKDRQLSPKGFTMGRDDDQNSTVFSDSSTTAVSSPSTQSLIGLPERRLENVQTFKSFKDWLGSFAPPGQVSDTSEFQKNLEALRLAHPELHGGDKTTKQHESTQGKVPLAPKAAKAPKAKPTNVFNAKSFEMSNRLGSGLLDKSNQIRLFIQGISKPGSTEELTEEVTIRPDAQVYEVLEELYNRGYTDICGFVCEGATFGPITASETAFPVLVTSGTSNYSVLSGLRVNEDEPLIRFYDRLLVADNYGASRETFSIQRQLNGILIQDKWLNRHIDKVPDQFISFNRTLRVPEDGQTYHLPASLGLFPILCSEKYAPSLPTGVSDKNGVLLPMFQREAMFLCFSRDGGSSNEVDDYAIKVFAGSVNAISGYLGDQEGVERPQKQQDYVVAPRQGRLDGFYTAKGIVNQFVAMPLGFAYTAESQLRGTEFIGGIQLLIAPQYKGHGHFSLEGHQRDCGPFVKPEIRTPDWLDRYKTPRELGLAPGRRIFVEGDELKKLCNAILVDPASLETLTDKKLYPRCGTKCRPTFVHELYGLPRDKILSRPMVLEVTTIPALTINVNFAADFSGSLLEDKADLPLTLVTQYYSPFLDVNDFKSQLFEEHYARGNAARYIMFNGAEHDEKPQYYDPIVNYDLDGGMITFSPPWQSAGTKGSLNNYKFPLTEEAHGRWEMGLAAGGGVYQEICVDSDPRRWNWADSCVLSVQILNSVIFQSVVGMEAPPCPISVQDYIEGRMPFYHIVQSTPINAETILKELSTIGQIDARKEITNSIFMSADGSSACAVCQKSLCDSILMPCQHIFCYRCIRKYMIESQITCAACRKGAIKIVEFSAPMELPVSPNTGSLDECTENEHLNSRPGSTEMTTSIVEPEVEAWAKILSPNADSPLLVNFIRHALNMQRQPLHLQVSATMGDVKEVKRLIAGNSQSLDAISEENGRTALQAASAANQLEIVKILIESGSDVNAAPARLNGRTALQAAAEAGHCEVAKTLIEKGADLLARCCQRPNRMENHHECPGREAIYFAAENGHADMLVLLLDASIARGLKPSLESLLSAAARSGNSATVKTLLKRGAQLSKCIGDPYTPLHEAAHGGHDDAISLLLASGADLHAKCNEETVLFLAAERGHKQTVRLIMSKFATFEPVEEPEKEDKWLSWGKKPQKYESALHLAAERGIESAVKLLLDSGFDANGNTIGVASTPLICAAKSGNLAILRMLVERGADVNYVSPSSHNNALHEAATNGHVDAVRFLLSKGLDVNAPGGGDRQALHFAAATGNELLVRILVESGAQIATQMWNYGTPLHVAAKGGFKSVVEFFLSLGIDPMIQSVPDRPSRIALHEAADTGMEDVVALLLDNGCDPNAMDYMGETPLVLAVARGSLNCVRLLLDHGANVHQNLNRSRPLLHRLSGREFGFSKNKVDFQTEAEERREIALLLLQHNADIYAGDHGKRDALAFALEMNNLMITKVLLEHLPVSSGTGFDISPNLLTAASRGHYEIVKLLLDHGADPNHKFSGKTPLGAAAREGHTDIVEVLARRGADFTEPCYKGLTPLQLAAESGRYAVVESLLQLGAEVDSNVAAGTALELAARNGHADVVWLLVASGADCSRLGAEEINPREYEMKGRMPAVQRVLQRAEKSDFSPSYSSKSGRQERHS